MIFYLIFGPVFDLAFHRVTLPSELAAPSVSFRIAAQGVPKKEQILIKPSFLEPLSVVGFFLFSAFIFKHTLGAGVYERHSKSYGEFWIGAADRELIGFIGSGSFPRIGDSY